MEQSFRSMEVGLDKGAFFRFLVEVERARYHEAGHAVIAFLMGRHLTRVSAVSDEDLAARRSGMTHYAPVTLTSRSRAASLAKAIRVALAGGIAERMHDATAPGGDEEDLAVAQRLALQYFLHPARGQERRELLAHARAGLSEEAAQADMPVPLDAELDRLRVETVALLRQHWPAVEVVVAELQRAEGEDLEGGELRRLIRRAVRVVASEDGTHGRARWRLP